VTIHSHGPYRLAVRDVHSALSDSEDDAFVYAYRALEDLARAVSGQEEQLTGADWTALHERTGQNPSAAREEIEPLRVARNAVGHGNPDHGDLHAAPLRRRTCCWRSAAGCFGLLPRTSSSDSETSPQRCLRAIRGLGRHGDVTTPGSFRRARSLLLADPCPNRPRWPARGRQPREQQALGRTPASPKPHVVLAGDRQGSRGSSARFEQPVDNARGENPGAAVVGRAARSRCLFEPSHRRLPEAPRRPGGIFPRLLVHVILGPPSTVLEVLRRPCSSLDVPVPWRAPSRLRTRSISARAPAQWA
jgi:hypothetical protein